MRRVTLGIVTLALLGSIAAGVLLGRMAGGAADQHPTVATRIITDAASTPTIAPLPTLPPLVITAVASPATGAGER